MRDGNPETLAEWQVAVDLASASLSLAMTGDDKFVPDTAACTERCRQLIQQGAERGIYPCDKAVQIAINRNLGIGIN